MRADDDQPAGEPAEPTALQLKLLAAYSSARTLFDRMEAPGAFFEIAMHTQNRRLIRWRRERLPFRSDAHEGMVLVGALSRLHGGQTLGELGAPIGVAEVTGAWMEALLAAAGLAAVHCLAIGPCLELVLDLVEAEGPAHDESVSTLAAMTDLAAITSARPETLPQGPQGVDAVRRALFAALGQVLTCGWIDFTRRVTAHTPLSPDETPAFYFTGAVDMLIGAARRGGSGG